jgi:hypothetical protein
MSSIERPQGYWENLRKDIAPQLPYDPIKCSWHSRGESMFKGGIPGFRRVGERVALEPQGMFFFRTSILELSRELVLFRHI